MLVMFALTLTVLLAFCGLALDVGYMELTKLKLQNAADAAALGLCLRSAKVRVLPRRFQMEKRMRV